MSDKRCETCARWTIAQGESPYCDWEPDPMPQWASISGRREGLHRTEPSDGQFCDAWVSELPIYEP